MMNRRGLLSFIRILPFIGGVVGVKAASASPSKEAMAANDVYRSHLARIDSVKCWKQSYDGNCGGDPRVEAIAKAINIKALCNEDVNTLVQGYEVGFSEDYHIVGRRSDVMIPSWWTSIDDAKRAVAAIDSMTEHKLDLPYKDPSDVFIKLMKEIEAA